MAKAKKAVKKAAPKKAAKAISTKRKSDGRSAGTNPMNIRASRLDDASPDKHQVSRPEDWDDIERGTEDDVLE